MRPIPHRAPRRCRRWRMMAAVPLILAAGALAPGHIDASAAAALDQ